MSSIIPAFAKPAPSSARVGRLRAGPLFADVASALTLFDRHTKVKPLAKTASARRQPTMRTSFGTGRPKQYIVGRV